MTSDVKKHATIFAEYQRRLYRYVDQARDAQRVRVGSGQDATPDILRARNEQDTVYATIKGNKPANGLILIEKTQERSIRKACESLAAHLIERIQNTFPAYDGGGVQGHAHLDAEKLVIDLDGEIPCEGYCSKFAQESSTIATCNYYIYCSNCQSDKPRDGEN